MHLPVRCNRHSIFAFLRSARLGRAHQGLATKLFRGDLAFPRRPAQTFPAISSLEIQGCGYGNSNSFLSSCGLKSNGALILILWPLDWAQPQNGQCHYDPLRNCCYMCLLEMLSTSESEDH